MTVFKHEHPTRGKTGRPANHPTRQFDPAAPNAGFAMDCVEKLG
jgi:hypothetical protein